MSRLSVGKLMPAILALGLLLDVASRFLPYDGVSFRAWETMTRRPPLPLGGIFQPNKRYENDRASGDLSAMSNRRWLRQVHGEVFTADAFGFRNAPAGLGGGRPTSAVMIGSSFTVGSTLSDEDTLPAQLSALLGGNVYNAASLDVQNPQALDALLERLALPPGSPFLVEALETSNPLAPAGARPHGRLEEVLGHRLGPLYARHFDAYSAVRGWLSPSPLQVSLVHLRKALQNDQVLPNAFAPTARLERLANGDPMLFLSAEGSAADDARTPADDARAFRSFAERLRARQLHLLVVLVPRAYSVYAPLLERPTLAPAGAVYLARLEAALRAADVDCVNVAPALEAAARQGLPEHRYVYWRDDTHWNKDGVTVAARIIAQHLRGP